MSLARPSDTTLGRPWPESLWAVVAVGATLYIAVRYSHKGGLVNVGFYLPALALVAHTLSTRGHELAALFRSRLGAAALAFAAALTWSVAIAPDVPHSADAFAKAHGHALAVALFVGIAATRRRAFPFLLGALVVGAVPEMLNQIGHHWRQWRETGRWMIDYPLAREYGDAYALYLPACVAMLVVTRVPGLRAAGWAFALLQSILLLLTGFRGAWLGAAAGVLVVALAARAWKATLVLGAAGVMAILALGAVSPTNLVSERLSRGLDTSNRVAETWMPALDLIAEKPLTGYGYGKEVFARSYESAQPQHPEWPRPPWLERTPWGPHNIYLGAMLAGGIFLFATMLWLFAEIALAYVRAWRSFGPSAAGALALGGLGALVSAYWVHGLFEEKFWPPLGILIGLALGLDRMRRAGAVLG